MTGWPRPRSGLVVLFIAFGIASCGAKSDGKEWAFADIDDAEDASESCADVNKKCGGTDWRGSTTCCDDSSNSGTASECFIKDATYSQCRSSCPSGWDCMTHSPTKLPTSVPTNYPTSTPTTSPPTHTPTTSVPSLSPTPEPSTLPPSYAPTVHITTAPTTYEYKILSMKEEEEVEEMCVANLAKCGGSMWEDGLEFMWEGGTACCDDYYACFPKDSTYSQCRTTCPDDWDCVDDRSEDNSATVTSKPSVHPTFAPTEAPTRIRFEPSNEPTSRPSSEPTLYMFNAVQRHEMKFDTWFVEIMAVAFFLGLSFSFVRTKRSGAPKPWMDPTWKKEMEMDDMSVPMWEMRFWQYYKMNKLHKCCVPRPAASFSADMTPTTLALADEEATPLHRPAATDEDAVARGLHENQMLRKQLAALGGSKSGEDGLEVDDTALDENRPKAPNMFAGIGNVKLKKSANRGPRQEKKSFAKKARPASSVPAEDDLEEGSWGEINTDQLPQTPEEVQQMFQENVMLKQQLKQMGATAVEAVPLAVAERRMRDAVRRLLEGDDRAENDVERWDRSIRMNPEYIKREERRVAAWEAQHYEENQEALKTMRSLVPPDVNNCNEEELIRRGIPKKLTKRMLERKTLWLVRYSPDFINKLHSAELSSKYSHQGLDIIEMRAVYASLPKLFENDNDGKKQQWREGFHQRLTDMCARVEKGSLSANDARCNAYTGCENLNLFNPAKGYIRTHTSKGDAFGATEKPVITRAPSSDQWGPRAKLTRSKSVMVTKHQDPSSGAHAASAMTAAAEERPARPAMAGLLGAIQKKKKGPQEEETPARPEMGGLMAAIAAKKKKKEQTPARPEMGGLMAAIAAKKKKTPEAGGLMAAIAARKK